jgi:hypothetical protein
MKNLIDKYLDGELTEEEATTLLEVIARDPELETELRAYEEMLSLTAGDLPDDPSAGFTEAVMDRIAAGRRVVRAAPSRRPARRPYGRAWRLGLAWAAALALTFAIGRMTAGNGFEPGAGSGAGPAVTSTPRAASGGDVQMAGASSLAERPRLIRLVYIPRDPDVIEVTIAGTFNGWNPGGITMEQAGDVWIARLILPPGTYEYMFIENGENWVTDPLALQTRDDGFGRKNAVLDVSI